MGVSSNAATASSLHASRRNDEGGTYAYCPFVMSRAYTRLAAGPIVPIDVIDNSTLVKSPSSRNAIYQFGLVIVKYS